MNRNLSRNIKSSVRLFTELNEKLAGNPVLTSVRRGLTYVIPFLLLGSLALMVTSLPVQFYQNGMESIFGANWKNVFNYIRDATFNILSLHMVLCVSYAYSIELGRLSDSISPVMTALVAFSSYIAIIGITKDSFSLDSFGVSGIFMAIVVALCATRLFLALNAIPFLKIKSLANGADSVFQFAVASFIPASLTVVTFAVVNQILSGFFGIGDIQAFLSDWVNGLFARIDSPLLSAILFILLVHILWFFGVHGSNVLEPVAQNFFAPGLLANYQAVQSGSLPENLFTKTFFDNFVLMGGCGTILCLTLAIFIAGRYKNQKSLSKISFLPVLFNINELSVFGLPIVLNPVYFIPFLAVPLLLTLISALAMYLGLVPYTAYSSEWTTPVFLSGYASTRSISGSLLQLFNLAVGVVCYIPFVRLADKVTHNQTEKYLKRVYTKFRMEEERGIPSTLLTRHDEIGNISRLLAADLKQDLKDGRITLYYQPQVDYTGKVFGLEALLRWNHESYGFIYPPLIIALADEAGFINELGDWIMDTALRDIKEMELRGIPDLVISVNVSAAQLDHEEFVDNLQQILKKHTMEPQKLKIEITEQLALTSSKRILTTMQMIKQMGIKLAMDDFGMGHSSLIYLKEYDFDTIKLDGSLTKELLNNTNCQNIISSIVDLGKSLQYSVIAEYVENEEQRCLLHELGCDRYQGYLYSKALPFEEAVEYIAECTFLN